MTNLMPICYIIIVLFVLVFISSKSANILVKYGNSYIYWFIISIIFNIYLFAYRSSGRESNGHRR